MNYHTQQVKLAYREYGRYVQNLVAYALTVSDRRQRTLLANAIVKIMAMVNPAVRQNDSYRQKLWDHLHLMTDRQLNIDSPFALPNQQHQQQPKPPPYPKTSIANRQYGKLLRSLAQKAANLPDPNHQTAMAKLGVGYMKTLHKNKNNQQDHPNEEILQADLVRLSDHRLSLQWTPPAANTRRAAADQHTAEDAHHQQPTDHHADASKKKQRHKRKKKHGHKA